MPVIARRTYPFDGEVTESAYEDGRYFIAGHEIAESLRNMQRDVLAFVSDSDQLVTLTLRVEAGPQDAVENVGVSGVAQYVGVPLRNSATQEEKRARGVRNEVVTLTGKVVEIGIGSYYVVQANGKEENFSAKAMQALYRAIDDYSKSRVYITCILDLELAEAGGRVLSEGVAKHHPWALKPLPLRATSPM